MLRRSVLDTFLYTAVGTDDVAELVGQIILSAHTLTSTVNGDTGPNRGRGHRKHGHDHPLGTRVVGVETEEGQSVVRQKLEDVECVLWGDDLFAVTLAIVVLLLLGLVCRSQLETFLPDCVGLDVAAAAVRDLDGLFRVLLADVLLTRVLGPRQTPNFVKTLLGVLGPDGVRPVRVVLVVAVSTKGSAL
jgi:hypothetical protein